MLEFIYKYAYCGKLTEKSKIDDIELILFNNKIPYKLERMEHETEVYVALIHEQLGKDILESLNNDNLIYKKAIDLGHQSRPRRRNVVKKFEYRKVMMILFLLMFVVLFMRSLLLLNILN